MMNRIVTSLILLFSLIQPLAFAQTVQTVANSPLIADYLAIDRATGDVYTTDYSQISRISPDGTVETVAQGGSFTTGIGVSSAGDVYFVDGQAGTIFKYDTAGATNEFATGLSGIVGVWMTSDNTGFYTHSISGTIYFVNFDGTVTQVLSGLGNGMTDIALDEDGNFYVSFFQTGQVNKVAPDGTITPLITIPSWVGYITFANGFVYATAWQNHQILRIDPETGESLVVAGSGIAGTADGAVSSAQFNEPNGIVASVTGDTLYVSDFASNSLRRITSVTTVSTEEDNTQPANFMLAQNYPNPFNPSTTISYSLNQPGLVKLVITDLLGRTMSTLVSAVQPAGSYAVNWDAGNSPSGVYLYRLEVEGKIETRRMILLR